MASTLFKRSSFSTVKSTALSALRIAGSRTFASVSIGTDLVSAAPDVSLQKARTWDEGVSSKFSTTPLKDIFKDKKVVIFGLPHVPSYKNNIDKFKAEGVDSVICVAVNDPYVMNGWADKLQAKDAVPFTMVVIGVGCSSEKVRDGRYYAPMIVDLAVAVCTLAHVVPTGKLCLIFEIQTPKYSLSLLAQFSDHVVLKIP